MKENNEILKIIGSNIKSARISKNYTQEQMAEQLNVSSKFISMLERGCSGLSITNLANICKVLDIEPNSLFNGILDYSNDKDTYIINALSTIANKDKDFLVNVIEYILNKS